MVTLRCSKVIWGGQPRGANPFGFCSGNLMKRLWLHYFVSTSDAFMCSDKQRNTVCGRPFSKTASESAQYSPGIEVGVQGLLRVQVGFDRGVTLSEEPHGSILAPSWRLPQGEREHSCGPSGLLNPISEYLCPERFVPKEHIYLIDTLYVAMSGGKNIKMLSLRPMIVLLSETLASSIKLKNSQVLAKEPS